MPLHRDIFWVGRQWAVTGCGMQAIDQRLNGKYDIDIARLWEDDPAESLRADGWLNAEDFAKGLFIARSRYPEPAGKAAPLRRPEPKVSRPEDRVPVEPPKPAAAKFDMRVESWTQQTEVPC